MAWSFLERLQFERGNMSFRTADVEGIAAEFGLDAEAALTEAQSASGPIRTERRRGRWAVFTNPERSTP